MEVTIEQAIKSLSAYIDNEAYTDKFQNVCKLAIEALEKQIPKKPEKEAEENMLCPICGSFLGYEVDCKDEHYQFPYCSGCGQAIKWESE